VKMNISKNTEGVILKYTSTKNNLLECIISNNDSLIAQLCNHDVDRFIGYLENYCIVEKEDYAIFEVYDPLHLRYILKPKSDIIASNIKFGDNETSSYETFFTFMKRKMEEIDKNFTEIKEEINQIKKNNEKQSEKLDLISQQQKEDSRNISLMNQTINEISSKVATIESTTNFSKTFENNIQILSNKLEKNENSIRICSEEIQNIGKLTNNIMEKTERISKSCSPLHIRMDCVENNISTTMSKNTEEILNLLKKIESNKDTISEIKKVNDNTLKLLVSNEGIIGRLNYIDDIPKIFSPVSIDIAFVKNKIDELSNSIKITSNQIPPLSKKMEIVLKATEIVKNRVESMNQSTEEIKTKVITLKNVDKFFCEKSFRTGYYGSGGTYTMDIGVFKPV